MENTKNIASSSKSESSDKVCKSCKKVFDEALAAFVNCKFCNDMRK